MRKTIIIIFIFLILITNQTFATDYKIANVTKVECLKHVKGEVFRIWIGDIERIYIYKNGSYECIWLEGDNFTKYNNDNILIVCNITGRCFNKNNSKVFNLVPGENNLNWMIEGNEFNFIIEIPILLTETPEITETPINTTNEVTTDNTTNTPTITQLNTPTPMITNINTNTNNNSTEPVINSTETPINTIEELPKTYDTFDTLKIIYGIIIILWGLSLIIKNRKRGV